MAGYSRSKPMEITRKFRIDAGHRLQTHGGKCRHLHGHSYEFHVSLTAGQLDEYGMVIDFSIIKEVLGGWLESNWDHTLILEKDDPLVSALSAANERVCLVPFAPTAENLAAAFGPLADVLLAPHKIRVSKVVLYETPNCWATYYAPIPVV